MGMCKGWHSKVLFLTHYFLTHFHNNHAPEDYLAIRITLGYCIYGIFRTSKFSTVCQTVTPLETKAFSTSSLSNPSRDVELQTEGHLWVFFSGSQGISLSFQVALYVTGPERGSCREKNAKSVIWFVQKKLSDLRQDSEPQPLSLQSKEVKPDDLLRLLLVQISINLATLWWNSKSNIV